jgi:hypothetical protein
VEDLLYLDVDHLVGVIWQVDSHQSSGRRISGLSSGTANMQFRASEAEKMDKSDILVDSYVEM